MKLLKSFIFILSVFGLFLLSNNTFAVDEVATGPTLIKLASVNITDAKIISSEQNTFSISFNISNGDGWQSGVKYGIKLFSQDDKGNPVSLVDEYVYPEVLSLQPKSVTKRDIIYIAPSVLSGDYIMILSSENESGFPFGTAFLGEIKLESMNKGIEILPETCKLSIGVKTSGLSQTSQMLSLGASDSLTLSCTVINNKNESVYLTPSFLTTYGNAYGKVAQTTEGETKSIYLDKLEKKTISIILPKGLEPQVYYVKTVLKDGEVNSNSIGTAYMVDGVNATIQNVFFDKDYYKKGDKAILSILWTSTGKANEDLSLSLSVKDRKDKECGVAFNQALTGTVNKKTEIPFTIDKKCISPTVLATIIDGSGKILDEKTFEMETKSISTTGRVALVIVLAFVLLIIIMALIFMNSKKNKNGEGGAGINPQMMMLVLLPVMFALIPFNFAKADTYMIDGLPNGVSVLISGINEFYTDGSGIPYSPGDYNNNNKLNVTTTFNLNGQPAGNYTLKAKIPQAENVDKFFTVPNGFNDFITPYAVNGGTNYAGAYYPINFTLTTIPTNSVLGVGINFYVRLPYPETSVSASDNSVNMNDQIQIFWATNNKSTTIGSTTCQGEIVGKSYSFDFTAQSNNAPTGSGNVNPSEPATYKVTCKNRDKANMDSPSGSCSGSYIPTGGVCDPDKFTGGATGYPDNISCTVIPQDLCYTTWISHPCNQWYPNTTQVSCVGLNQSQCLSRSTGDPHCTWNP